MGNYGRTERKHFDHDEMHWYALDVVRQKEYVAGYLLNKAGAVTFIPTGTRFRKKNRYTKGNGIEVAHAAMPGLLFAGFADDEAMYRALRMHLVNGVISVDDKPRRIDTASKHWLDYRGHVLDGNMTLERHKVTVKVKGEEVEVERSVPFISVQGRGVLRTHTAMKQKAAKDRPMVIRAAGERARLLGGMLMRDNPQRVVEAA